LASLSKPFTAAAILMLAHENKVSLNDSVSRFVDGVPANWGHVTIRNLLSHTSEIDDPIDNVPDPGTNRTPAEMLQMVTMAQSRFRPGENWSYNNTGYYLLGLVIEKASGQPLDEFLAERIFRPNGMNQTRANDLSEVVRKRASGYVWRDGRFRNVRPVSPSLIAGAGHVVSTVLDLAKWDAALGKEALLPKHLRDQLWTAARLNDKREVTFNFPVEVLKGASYGYGWFVGNMNGHRYAAHGGISPSGFSTFMLRFLDERVTVIVLTNRSDVEDPWRPGAPRPEDIARQIATLYIAGLREK
jgi:CubicO group peptidase (beta-lactamase class C family)